MKEEEKVEGEKEEELPLYYSEGAAIEAKVALYRHAKETFTETLQMLSHMISNIEGKEEEVTRCVYGDKRAAVSFITLPFFFTDEVLSDEAAKTIKLHVRWYNEKVKVEQYVNAGVALSDLKVFLLNLRDEKAKLLHIDIKSIQKKAHTPIVIKAKKKGGNHDKELSVIR